MSRVACETLVTTGLAFIAGEITTKAYADLPAIVRETIKDIGYTRAKYGFDYETCAVISAIHEQSPDIAMGVDPGGAGDQGLMFGYACRETPELMPLPIMLAHKLTRRLSQVRREGLIDYLRPDGKSQVTVEYEGDKPVRVDTVVISTQHSSLVPIETVREDVLEKVIQAVVPAELLDEKTKYYINPTGPLRDRRAPGRLRPHRPQDHRRHLRRRGQPRRRRLLGQGPDEGRPLGLLHGSPRRQEHRGGRASPTRWSCSSPTPSASPTRSRSWPTPSAPQRSTSRILVKAVREVFPLTPKGIIEYLNLRRPIYKKTAAFGHFGRTEPEFTWEHTNKAAELKAFFKK